MTYKLLKKGIEIELFAGNKSGEVLPLARKLQEHFPSFSCEPDERNFEYITKPTTDYYELYKEIIEPRLLVREFLNNLGGLTLIPGSTIPLEFSKDVYYSKPGDPYHEFILKTYKTNVITTSLHINIGIDDHETLFKLLGALRLDTPLFLALSASSCFHDGKNTEYHSYRWHSFPKTPEFVPFFNTHNEYIKWTENELSAKKMQNVRHLWTSIRPNGPNRPYDLNRIEIRICDLVTNTSNVIAIVAFIESIIQKYLIENNWPKILNKSKTELDKLVKIIDEQEERVAKSGLKAKIWNWREDTEEEAGKIIESVFKESEEIHKKLNISSFIKPVTNILTQGNEASQFLEDYKKTNSIKTTIQHFIDQFTIMDLSSQDILKVKK